MATVGVRSVRWIAVAGMISAVACSTETAGINESTARKPELILSDTAASVAGAVSTAIASNSAVVTSVSASTDAGQVAYISLPPGTVPSGVTATIRNRVTGIGLTVAIIDGGFDPVPIAAVAGDVLDIEVRLAGSAAPQMYSHAVPGKRRPKVVRTNPPRGKRDVALNATIHVVFSEPIDARTLTGTSVRLEHDGAAVAGSLAFEDAAHLTVVITPLASFEEGAEYRLTVTQDVRDLDGEPLEASVTVEFTTASIGGSAVGRIAFADWNTISVINTDGTGLTSLIDDDGQGWTYMSPAWSPDGSQIAFGSSRDGGWDIYVINADGSGLRRLTTHGARDDSPAWSPDGSQIAFTSDRDGDFEIHVMNADGSNLRRVTDHPAEDGDPNWSPDGGRITFTSNRDGYHEIYVINLDGTGTRRVTDVPDPGRAIQPHWSSGNTIVFTVTDLLIGIYTVSADGGQPRRLTQGGGAPSWSPDGTRIVYAGGNLQIMNADGSNRRDLGVFGYEPAWSPTPR